MENFNITRVTTDDAKIIADLGARTFLESHGASASEIELDYYVKKNYSILPIQQELHNPTNNYHLIHLGNEPIGFSNILFNKPTHQLPTAPVAKLDRIYILEKFHGKGFGKRLFDFNLRKARKHNQKGIWLYTWTGNKKAIDFYLKVGFEIIGKHNFPISPNHSNPNYLLHLSLI